MASGHQRSGHVSALTVDDSVSFERPPIRGRNCFPISKYRGLHEKTPLSLGDFILILIADNEWGTYEIALAFDPHCSHVPCTSDSRAACRYLLEVVPLPTGSRRERSIK